MKKIVYKKLSEEEAKKILKPEDYEKFKKLMKGSPSSSFGYTDRFGAYSVHKGVDPIGYFMTPGYPADEDPGRVYLWAYHSIHGKKESYVVSRIGDVEVIPGFMDGLTDPSTWGDYWSGSKDWEESIPL